MVREILSEKTIDSFNNPDGHGVYLLKKSGIDTNHALIDIEKRYGLVLKSLGLKDANAKTEQYVFTYKKINSLPEYTGKKYSAQRLGFFCVPECSLSIKYGMVKFFLSLILKQCLFTILNMSLASSRN